MAEAKIYTYDPKQVICLVGGFPIELAGPLVISRTNDVTTEQVGQTGESICVNLNRNKIGTVTIPVMAQSLYDTAFDEIAQYPDKAILPFYLIEVSTKKFLATTCWYKTQPDLSYGDQVEYRAHTFTLADASLSLSGNATSVINQIESLASFGSDLI
ncbi:putative structural protein [Vibrio phage VPMCC14]|nr:putative structural protein [Vibrio phage VPMCC14]